MRAALAALKQFIATAALRGRSGFGIRRGLDTFSIGFDQKQIDGVRARSVSTSTNSLALAGRKRCDAKATWTGAA